MEETQEALAKAAAAREELKTKKRKLDEKVWSMETALFLNAE